MSNFLFLIAGLGFGIWLAMRHGCASKKTSPKSRAKTKQINARKRENRAEKKKKILALLKTRKKVKNNDIERLLKVSDATVTNYMDQLENEGKVVQRGDRKAAIYTLK